MFLKNKVSFSLIALTVATSAAFVPLPLLAIIAGILFFAAAYRWPVVGLATAILATTLGEFGRIELGTFSFLALDLLVPAVLLAWLARKLIRQAEIRFDFPSVALLLFWGVTALSLLLGSRELADSEFNFAALHLLRFVAISGLFFVARDVASQRVKVSNVLLLAGVLLAVGGFYLLTVFPDFAIAGLTELGWDPHIGRLTGTWLDPNFAAGAFAFLLALAGARFLVAPNSRQKVILLAVSGVLFVALALTFSRSGLLALGVSGLALGLIRSRKFLVIFVLVGILGIAASPRLTERLTEFTSSVQTLGAESQQILDPTAQLRVDSWREGWRIWSKQPIFGVGFGAYKFHQTFTDEESHAATGSDSSLLNIAATTGVLGLLTFLSFLASLALAAWQNRRSAVAVGWLAGTLGLLVHSFFVNSLFFPPLALYFFVAGGLITAQKVIPEVSNRKKI